MRSCLCLFFKKETGEERRYRIHHIITLTTVPLLHIIPHVVKWETEEREWKLSNLLRIKMLMNCKFRVWKLKAHMLLTMVLCSKFLWATQQSQKQTNSKIRTLHWSCLFSCLLPTPYTGVWIPRRNNPFCLVPSSFFNQTQFQISEKNPIASCQWVKWIMKLIMVHFLITFDYDLPLKKHKRNESGFPQYLYQTWVKVMAFTRNKTERHTFLSSINLI